MRKIIYAESVSLDGFIEDEQGNIDWTTPSEELHQHFNDRENEFDTHLYGRKVYNTMLFWHDADQNPDLQEYMKAYARIWRRQQKIVFSTTLKTIENGFELKNAVDPQEITEWKKSPGKNMMVGGANLASTFFDHGLLDEVHMYIYPVLLGGGKPMFPSGDLNNLDLIESKQFPGGVIMRKYRIQH